MAPLGLIAWVSWYMELGIESPILVGTLRTFFQLSILSLILDPIFVLGVEMWWLVLLYTFFMVLLAAYESSSRSKYYFHGMFWYVLGTLLVNVALVSVFAFAIILQPQPLWDPQYVIPIVGMLLGNCINGTSLSLNAILMSMVESSREVELLLSFGANSYEASSRLFREAVRIGTMPQLNSMAIIGIIAIPGMMTGQILGGSTVSEAARYQILIMYLIAVCCFGTILTEVSFTLRVCFDSKMIHRTDRLFKRADKPSFLSLVRSCCDHAGVFTTSRKRRSSSASSFTFSTDEATYLAPKGELIVTTSGNSQKVGTVNQVLSISELSYAFGTASEDDDGLIDGEYGGESAADRRVLFQNLRFQMDVGGTALVDGPSGVGKSTLLRILAGLAQSKEGKVLLCGRSQSSYKDMPSWRKQVRYVPQTKVDIPGTPSDLLKKIASFQVWKREDSTAPPYADMKATTRELIKNWGMKASLLDSEWKSLSGGESQRTLVALALASRPKVIMLDESTSALDFDSKVRVEKSVAKFCKEHGMCAIWITHDKGQQDRMQMA
jgi:putative ABC transport system permease protein